GIPLPRFPGLGDRDGARQGLAAARRVRYVLQTCEGLAALIAATFAEVAPDGAHQAAERRPSRIRSLVLAPAQHPGDQPNDDSAEAQRRRVHAVAPPLKSLEHFLNETLLMGGSGVMGAKPRSCPVRDL